MAKEPYKKVLDFLLKISPGSQGEANAYSKIVGDTENIVSNGPCHAQMLEVNNPVCLGGGFAPSEEMMPVAKKVWEWATSDKSPWKCLMKNGIELVEKDGLYKGWILPEKTLRETPFNLHKNFCIFTRVISEKFNRFKTWDNYVSLGVDPTDAFYLCSMSWLNDKQVTAGGDINGGHWPLTDYTNEYNKVPAKHSTLTLLDWKAYRTGELDFTRYNPRDNKTYKGYLRPLVNGYFMHPVPVDYKPFKLTKLPMTPVKGRFSSAAYYEVNDVLDEFYKWQDSEGILK